MILESAPWKQELSRHKRSLERAATGPLSEEGSDYPIEKPLLYSALIMRRLIESRKVTDVARSKKFALRAFPTLPNRKSVLSRLLMQSDIDREFDLSAPAPIMMDCWDISSEVIHSGYLNWELSRKRTFQAILIASLRNQQTRLLRIPLRTYFAIINTVLTDQVTSTTFRLSPQGKLEAKLS